METKRRPMGGGGDGQQTETELELEGSTYQRSLFCGGVTELNWTALHWTALHAELSRRRSLLACLLAYLLASGRPGSAVIDTTHSR